MFKQQQAIFHFSMYKVIDLISKHTQNAGESIRLKENCFQNKFDMIFELITLDALKITIYRKLLLQGKKIIISQNSIFYNLYK